MNRRIVLTAAALAGALALGGGVALAATSGPESSTGVITGCYTNAAVNGSHALFVQNAGTSCPKGTSAISWNEQGPAGLKGTSATVTPLASGNTNCPGGGAEIQDGTPADTAYACNGNDGANGTDGTNGTNAAPEYTWTLTCATAPACIDHSVSSIPAGTVLTPVAISATGGCPAADPGLSSVTITDASFNLLADYQGWSGSSPFLSLSGPDTITSASAGPLGYTIYDNCSNPTPTTVTFTFDETQPFS
jgi:hypothetical protein